MGFAFLERCRCGADRLLTLVFVWDLFCLFLFVFSAVFFAFQGLNDQSPTLRKSYADALGTDK